VDQRAAVEAAIAAFASGDPDRIVNHIDPEFEGEVPASMSAEPDRYLGHEGVRRYFSTFEEAIEGLKFESAVVEQIGDWFIAELHATGKGRTSGIPVDLVAFATVLLRDGRLWKMSGHPSIEEARAAVTSLG
jgi:ketosteroid isomerase-like protein